MNSTAAEAASPASFQPPKAAISTGWRSTGRSFQMTSDTHVTVTQRVSVRPGPHHGRIAAEAPPRTTVAELRAGTDGDAIRWRDRLGYVFRGPGWQPREAPPPPRQLAVRRGGVG
jgi:hypothetical protein